MISLLNPYTPAFRSKMVQRLLGPGRISATSLARETGLPVSTLSLWVRQATSVPDVPKARRPRPNARKVTPSESRSAEDRLRVVFEASRLSGEALGAFLRSEGLHESTLDEWREAAVRALEPASANKGSGAAKRISELERQLHRKDKALAEAAALLMLQKKVQALWAVADDDTDPPSDE